MSEQFKYHEIEDHFHEFINSVEYEWVEQNFDDLHHHAYNMDYYIIGRYQATKWLGDRVFDCINIIKEYEQDNFGEVTTDLSDPEKVVNMYTYIIGEQVVFEWQKDNGYFND